MNFTSEETGSERLRNLPMVMQQRKTAGFPGDEEELGLPRRRRQEEWKKADKAPGRECLTKGEQRQAQAAGWRAARGSEEMEVFEKDCQL